MFGASSEVASVMEFRLKRLMAGTTSSIIQIAGSGPYTVWIVTGSDYVSFVIVLNSCLSMQVTSVW